ncbi:MAG: phosphoglucosamine mutase [Promethearchaeota archaeon]
MTRLFGTQGFRGLVNESLTATVAHNVGLAMAQHLGLENVVGIGWDTRISSEMLAFSVSAGLMSGGCNVQLLGLAPTPLLSFAIPRLELDAGVMVTASHNPPEFNGLKLWGSDGASYTSEMERSVENHYFSTEKPKLSWQNYGSLIPPLDFRPHYIEKLVSQIDIRRIRNHEFTVVVDCGGGAASVVVPELFKTLGLNTELLFCEPDGLFKNRLPEPKEQHLSQLIQRVKETNADLGIAWDGDADRVVLISNTGRYIMGDRVFALATFRRLRELKEKPKRIVSQVATSDVIIDVARMVEAELIITQVGEPNIVQKMKQVNAAIGGEENGGVIYKGWSWTREGMLTALLILDLIASENRSVEELDQQFPTYYQVKAGLSCENWVKEPLLKRVVDLVPTGAECETLDGVKFRYPDGWVLLRPSGTEPIFRVFAEAQTKSRAQTLVGKGLKLTQDALNEIRSRRKSLKR